jgi:NAD-dependent SIR2 family protein deacetylase
VIPITCSCKQCYWVADREYWVVGDLKNASYCPWCGDELKEGFTVTVLRYWIVKGKVEKII